MKVSWEYRRYYFTSSLYSQKKSVQWGYGEGLFLFLIYTWDYWVSTGLWLVFFSNPNGGFGENMGT